MNRFIYLFLLLGCAASALVGCTADPQVDPLPSTGDAGPSWVTINFSDNSFDEINITTRATLDYVAESRVSNLFVFLFDSAGERVYGRFFDHTNRVDLESDLLESKVECWRVTGNAEESEPEGEVRIFAPEVTGGSLYILANVNTDMTNISPDKLRFVERLSDLEAMTATLNQQITERSGFFPMTGSASLIDVKGGDMTIPASDENTNGKIMLTRLDAKVEVKVRVAAGYEASNTNLATSVTTTHKIKSFVPLSWQVVNLPRTAFVLPRAGEDAETEMFNTQEIKFETREPDEVSYKYTDKNGVEHVVTDGPTEAHGFSFYMLENRHKPADNLYLSDKSEKPLIEGNNYHLRDTRNKDAAGAYDTSNGLWKYAPEAGTYLIIKGEVVMELGVSNEGRDQQLSADVEYYIHLGDFGSDVNNYDVLRNTSYTYTITIYGVDNIQIEVDTKTVENESGATGHVYVAKESILAFDSHYGRAVVPFDEDHITGAEHLSWYVKTPFGREGKPYIIGGVEVPAGLDYQWVHFMVNGFDETGKYSDAPAKYNPEKVMDILQFSKYIKEQKAKFQKDKADGRIDNESDFRPVEDEKWKEAFPNQQSLWTRYRIYVTIFVDEFYYAANPLTNDVRTDLWKDFVNQPDRMMHILCDVDKSADEASRTTSSIVTISQRSIQTVFNTEKPELKTAWGCETIDETRDQLWYYSRSGEHFVQDPNLPANYMMWQGPSGLPTNDGNTSQGNGLYNTAKIWGLTSSGSYESKPWSEYVDHSRELSLYDADDKETLRYACLTRNRDENGNGQIDAKEIKWYLASISQLTSLYIGDQGISPEALLYPYYKKQVKDNVYDERKAYTWRAHVVSSTAIGGGWPEILWAEEGLSTGQYNEVHGKSARLTVRCVRNLGMDASSEDEAQKNLLNEKYIPEKAIDMKGPSEENADTSSVYKFDMTNMNPLSIRYYSSHELEPRNEHSVEARVYWAFETGPLTDEKYSYDDLHKIIREGKSPCPEGYRVPNVREGALMSVRCPYPWQKEISTRVSTFFSHGLLGRDQDPGAAIKWENKETGESGFYINKSKSWLFNGTRTYLDHGGPERIRCVKDIRQ